MPPKPRITTFIWKDFQARNNNELVAVLGNFVNRALVLTQKYYGGEVPACGEMNDYDRQTVAEVAAVKGSLEANIENYRFREALKDAMNIARIGNKYLADTEPWKVIKTDSGRVKTILNIALQITANTAIAIEPFMPFSASKILKMLAVEKFGWERLGAMDLIAAGHKIGEASLLVREDRRRRHPGASWTSLRRRKRQTLLLKNCKILNLRKIRYCLTISRKWISGFLRSLRRKRSPRRRNC